MCSFINKKNVGCGIAVLVGGILSLSVHIVMSQVLHMGYPSHFDFTFLQQYIVQISKVFGSFLLFWFSYGYMKRFGSWSILFYILIIAAIGENFRGFIMEFLVTGGFMYSLLDIIPNMFEITIISIVMWIYFRLGFEKKLIINIFLVIILAFVSMIVSGYIGSLVSLLKENFLTLDPNKIVKPPYGWSIILPAYLTYFITVIACTLIWVAMLDKCLHYSYAARIGLLFITIILTYGYFKGIVAAFIAPSFWLYMYSFSQFILEKLVLAINIVLAISIVMFFSKNKNYKSLINNDKL